MTVLVFRADDMRRVVEHSLSAPRQADLIVDYDEKKNRAVYRKPESPAVLLVHDHGVYIMSNGEPRDLRCGEGGHSFVAYAIGCNPLTDGQWWETSRDLVGGDDFAEPLPCAHKIKAMLDRKPNAKTVKMTIDECSIKFEI